MTEYAYKLVSVNLGGGLDWFAIKKARDRGWDPVPLGEEPNPFSNPIGMTSDQMLNFRLCRMPLDKHQQITGDHEFLNAALVDTRVHKVIAAGNIQRWIDEHALDVAEQDKPENALQVASWSTPSHEGRQPAEKSAEFVRRVQVAYDWLHARGLA